MTDKMRKDFVTWLESLSVGYDARFTDFIGGLGDGEFYDAEVQGLWTTWQASRAAIEIQEPDDFTKGGNANARILISHHREIVKRWINLIQAAGLKVNP